MASTTTVRPTRMTAAAIAVRIAGVPKSSPEPEPAVLPGSAPALPAAAGPSGSAVTAGTSALTAASGSTKPQPNWSSRPAGPLSTAVLNRRLTTLAASSFGYFDQIRASTPDTIAVDSLVPELVPKPDA